MNLARSGNVDQPTELADLLGMKVIFAPAIELEQGGYGIALLSRDDLPAVVEPLPRLDAEEPRVAIVSTWRKIGVVTTHLSRDPGARRAQTNVLASLTRKLGIPAIVLGDLNQPADALGPLTSAGLMPVRPRRSLLQLLRRGHQIDHILVTNDVVVTKAWTVPTSVSDHDPLVAEIVLPDA